jgi:hypothetical protein
MRTIGRLTALLITAALATGCDPLERRFVNEGAGVDLYTADRASQTELLHQYVAFICEMSGPSCGSNWTTFVQAGMNDIDQRCDSYLTWLDAKRRDKEPVLAEISAINTATHAVMTVTGASPRALDIVTAAFGLASASYNNWNSRLLISVNQSTVQDLVYTSQGQFRDKLKDYAVPDQPAAIYLLRNYLRLCMPITIEASINTTTTLVQRGAPLAAVQTTVVKSTSIPKPIGTVKVSTTFEASPAGDALKAWIRPGGVLDTARISQIKKFIVDKGFDPATQVTTFLNGSMFAAARIELARNLGLIQ